MSNKGKGTKMTEDRRRSERLDKRNASAVVCKAWLTDCWTEVKLVDISGIGVGITVEDEIAIGGEVMLIFDFADKTGSVSVKAKVIRKSKAGLFFNVGLEFIKFEDKNLFIQNFCTLLLDAYYE